jgi:hypothetical protein
MCAGALREDWASSSQSSMNQAIRTVWCLIRDHAKPCRDKKGNPCMQSAAPRAESGTGNLKSGAMVSAVTCPCQFSPRPSTFPRMYPMGWLRAPSAVRQYSGQLARYCR